MSISIPFHPAGAGQSQKSQKPVLLAALFVAATLAGPGQAQDIWSGAYAGLHAGGATANTDWTLLDSSGSVTDRGNGFTDDCETSNPQGGCNPTFDLAGSAAGLQVGWQRQFGTYVIGAEASFTSAGFEETTVSEVGAADDTFTTRIDGYGALVAKAGWTPSVSAPVLIYATAGIASADVDTRIEDAVGAFAGSGATTERHSGWTAGLGAEYMVRPNVVIGLDYKYIDLASQEHEVNWDSGDTTVDDVDVDFETLALRVSYKF